MVRDIFGEKGHPAWAVITGTARSSTLFGEPILDIKNWMRTDANGKDVINIPSTEKLYQMPKLYAASLLWMLSELDE